MTAYTEFVKEYAKSQKIKYFDAVKIIKLKGLWNPKKTVQTKLIDDSKWISEQKKLHESKKMKSFVKKAKVRLNQQ